jgi:hypothetical protein
MKLHSIRRGLLALAAIGAAAACLAQSPPYLETGASGSFDLSNWGVDRYAPNAWTPNVLDPLGSQALRVHIDNADRRDLRTGYGVQFYDTQGRVRLNGFKATEVGGEVFIPMSWELQGNLRQAALWSRDSNTVENDSFYPIISFINNDPDDPYNPEAVTIPRFRIWDSTVGWIDRPDIAINWDQYNSFVIRDTGHSHQYFINGNLVEELSGSQYSAAGAEGIKEVILEATNFGLAENEATLPDSSYDVLWRNVYAIDPPVANPDNLTVDVKSNVPLEDVLLANDTSLNNRTLSLDSVTQPDHGSIVLVGGKLQYTVNHYSGPDQFDYTITDEFGQTSQSTAHITVQESRPESLDLSPYLVKVGGSSVGTVVMDHALATGSYVVNLSSSLPSVASVPDTMTITSGDTGTFTIDAVGQVAVDTQVVIKAKYNGKTVQKTITVKPISMASIKVSPSNVVGGAEDSFVTIRLSGTPTVNPITVTLTSSDPNTADLNEIGTVTFEVGENTKVVPIDTHVVSTATDVTFTAELDSVAMQDDLHVRPVKLSAFSVSTKSLNPGEHGTGTLTLTKALLPGESVDVVIAAPSILSHPETVTITGSDTGTFEYTAATGLGYKAIVQLSAELGFRRAYVITINK